MKWVMKHLYMRDYASHAWRWSGRFFFFFAAMAG
jgi:hypothetical protein